MFWNLLKHALWFVTVSIVIGFFVLRIHKKYERIIFFSEWFYVLPDFHPDISFIKPEYIDPIHLERIVRSEHYNKIALTQKGYDHIFNKMSLKIGFEIFFGFSCVWMIDNICQHILHIHV